MATLARVVVEFALDELDAEGYVLYVKPVPAPRANKIRLEQGKLDAAGAEYVRERKKRVQEKS